MANGVAVLADFATSKIFNVDLPSLFTLSGMRSQRKIAYLAPELIVDPESQRTRQSDVYAFGCTVVEVFVVFLQF
jgi:serine/threonine protein kinase